VKPGPVDTMVVVKPKPGATSASGIRYAVSVTMHAMPYYVAKNVY